MPSVADFRYPHPPFPLVSNDERIQDHYVECRRNGTSHRLAEMLAFRQCPRLDTETQWLAGHDRSLREDMPDLVRNRLLQQARAAGVNTERAVYKGQLARFPGDPEAWVSSKDDVKRVAEKRGMKLEGGIEYTPPGYDDVEPQQLKSRDEYQVAPDIVNAAFRDVCEAQPEEARRPGAKQELAEKLAGRQ